MAHAGDLAAPIELKAVDAAWPLVGRLTLKDGRRVGAPPAGTAWLAEGAAQRLGIGAGGTVTIGTLPLRVGGLIADEPDRLGEGFALGPVVIVAADFPARAGLTAPGAMYRTKIRIALPRASDPQGVVDRLKARFPSSGFEIRTRDKAAPGAERFVSRMGDFLVLVGLAALVIAGIGIGGGVSSYLEARRTSVATLKVLGATSRDIARIYLLQITAAALVGSHFAFEASSFLDDKGGPPRTGQLLLAIDPASPAGNDQDPFWVELPPRLRIGEHAFAHARPVQRAGGGDIVVAEGSSYQRHGRAVGRGEAMGDLVGIDQRCATGGEQIGDQ